MNTRRFAKTLRRPSLLQNAMKLHVPAGAISRAFGINVPDDRSEPGFDIGHERWPTIDDREHVGDELRTILVNRFEFRFA